MNGEGRITTLMIATYFSQLHRDVLRECRRLLSRHPLIGQHLTVSTYQDRQNKTRPMYVLDKLGFEALVFGFKGERHAAWRVEYLLKSNPFSEYAEKQSK